MTWRSSACYKTMIRPITQALRGRVRKMGWGALAALKPARPDPSAGDRARSKGNASRPPQDHQSSASRPYGGLGARLWSSGSRHPKTLIGTLKCPSDGRSARPPEDAPRCAPPYGKVLMGPLEGAERPGSAARLFWDVRGQRAKRGGSYPYDVGVGRVRGFKLAF